MAIVMAWEPRHPGPDRDALPCPQGPGPGGSTRWHSQHAVWGGTEPSHASRDVYTLGPQNPAGVLPAAQRHCLRKDVPPGSLESRAWAALILGQCAACTHVRSSPGTAPSPAPPL